MQTVRKMWPIATDGAGWSICLSVSHAIKQRNWSRWHLGGCLRSAQGRNYVLDGVKIPKWEVAILGIVWPKTKLQNLGTRNYYPPSLCSTGM